MTPQRPKRVTQAQIDTLPDGRDLPHYVSNWPQPTAYKAFTVTCRRRMSPGQLTVNVRAESAERAKEMVRLGQVSGIGLGWLPGSAVEVP